MIRPGNLGNTWPPPKTNSEDAESDPSAEDFQHPYALQLKQAAMAQQAQIAGRPLTVAEMHGGVPQQLFRGYGENKKPPINLIIVGLVAIALTAWLAQTKLPQVTR